MLARCICVSKGPFLLFGKEYSSNKVRNAVHGGARAVLVADPKMRCGHSGYNTACACNYTTLPDHNARMCMEYFKIMPAYAPVRLCSSVGDLAANAAGASAIAHRITLARVLLLESHTAFCLTL